MNIRHLPRAVWITCCVVFLPISVYADSRPSPRYTMPSGRGWAVCEAYLEFLNALPASEEFLTCDLRLKQVPGMREPDWHEMDISQNLDIVHQIEVLLGVGHIEPNPDKDFERWKRQREARMKSNEERPRLRRVRLAVAANGAVETVVSYNYDIQMCAKQLQVARTGKPYSHQLGEPNFFILDEAKRKVMGSSYWMTTIQGELLLFLGKPYYFDLGFGNHNWDIGGHLFIKRLEPIPPSFSFHSEFPNDPLYDAHELCRIRFDYPFPRH